MKSSVMKNEKIKQLRVNSQRDLDPNRDQRSGSAQLREVIREDGDQSNLSKEQD